jgi:diadenosine tetraphosphatase ApaH/serine/threonine PP2A family protein phosphatase
VDRLAEVGAIGVAGNHDLAALGGPEIDWFNPDARAAMEWTRRRIGERTRSWLASLPKTRIEAGMTLVHGSPRDPVWEYVTSLPVARTNLAALDTPIGLHGHTHLPMVWAERDGRIDALVPGNGATWQRESGRALLNPGSVGQPRDGDPASSWLEIDTDTGRSRWRRVAYDIAAVRAAMADVGLPRRLGDRLPLGL